MSNYELEIYKDKGGEFRWKRVASNGQIIAASAKGFQSKGRCATDEASAFVVGWRASENINRVEGLSLTGEMRAAFGKFVNNAEEPAARREALMQRYGGKASK